MARIYDLQPQPQDFDGINDGYGEKLKKPTNPQQLIDEIDAVALERLPRAEVTRLLALAHAARTGLQE